ncbi:carbohydrate ABC transporter permease [Kineococcus rhizosphaerae]|uniref:Multiple sugar transport system permease protein/raffinose/stachyose/melibiose transport system permease protein n=1 Tax=Kineococcus rhizosphaerae TaxID=559628 RepID=A0A2T0R7N6_9ACTN|nr:carbohydrate ABC transporter permease [Kineococcus rhizosphaerae]PRY17151.1 multiple sugar transport system permease protein/raffinose/stachyose/melibiose transport system permease protein [Kineococcus rhizosphaerae]
MSTQALHRPQPVAVGTRAPRTAASVGRRVLWHAVMGVVAAAAVAPLLYMVLTSIRPQATAFSGPIVPDEFSGAGYAFAWNDLQIWRNFLNSVLITGVTLALTIAAATLAGYAFSRIGFTARNLLFFVVTSALFLPGVATLIPVYLELQSFGLLGSRLGLILVYTAGGVSFSLFLMRTFFDALPNELSEAARLDGASELQIFWRVMLPLSAPGIATVAIFQMISVWNELLFASALVSDPASRPIQPVANSLISQYGTNWPALTATMTLTALPMVVAYVVFQRWFVAGLTAGAVKA